MNYWNYLYLQTPVQAEQLGNFVPKLRFYRLSIEVDSFLNHMHKYGPWSNTDLLEEKGENLVFALTVEILLNYHGQQS